MSFRFLLFTLLAATLFIQITQTGSCRAQAIGPPFENQIIDEIRIEIDLTEDEDADRWERVARDMIFLREGEPFSDERFSQTISALNRSRLFQSIDVPDPDWTEPSFTMTFRLKPFFRVKDIRISGGFPLLEREIIDTMSVYTGDAYIPRQIEEQAEYIKDLFKREGYIDPNVTLRPERDPDDGHYILHIDIDKGSYYETTNVRTQGNENFSGKRLLFRLNTWQSSLLFGGASRYVETDLEEDLDILRRFYWGRDFCEAQIDAEVKFSEDKTRARIFFLIDEGPRYDVKITGNSAFWTRTLRNEMVIYEDGNINDFGMRRSIRNIETRYRNAGYADVRINRIEERYEEKGQDVRSIELAINEGPRYIVDNISISGNENLATSRIRDQMLTSPPGIIYAGQFVPGTLTEDIAAIRSLYRQRGYLTPQISLEVQTRDGEDETTRYVDLQILINEGPRTMISGVQIENLTVLDDEEAIRTISIEPGDPYRDHRIQDSRIALAARISEKGHPHVRVDTEIIMSADETSAELIFQVNEGPYAEMASTFFTGNFLTRERTLRRQMLISEGDPFSLSDMLASQRNIRNINALATARFQTIGLEERADRITLLAEVNERKPYFYQFAAGYDTSRLMYFNTGGGTINLLGRNKELRAFAELSMIGYMAEIVYTEPNLFNTRIVADAAVFTEDIEEINQNFGVRSSGASVNLSRFMTPTISASLGFLYDYRDQYRTDDTPISPEDQEQYRSRAVLVTTPGITYNSTDSFVRPTRGIRTSASVGISTGLDNDLDNFLKYRLNTRYYYTPARRITLALLGQVGYIDPYGAQDAIPDDQLFFLGGTMNVRGFSENRLRVDEDRNPIGGRTSLMGSLEARYNFWRGFELALFYDTGTIRYTLRDEGSDDWRSSVGLGLRYHTAIGPIGLMHGWKLDRREGESPGAYHFSIGYTF
jgi:outer membrane protein insertion porin family